MPFPIRHRGGVVGVGVAVVANRHLGGDLRAVLQLDLLFRPRCYATAFLMMRRAR